MINWISEMKTNVETGISNIINSIVTFFSELPSKIWTWLVETVTNIVTWIANMKQKAEQGVSNIVNSIVNWFKQLPGQLINVGKNMVQGLWNRNQ